MYVCTHTSVCVCVCLWVCVCVCVYVFVCVRVCRRPDAPIHLLALAFATNQIQCALRQRKICILGEDFASGLQEHSGLDRSVLPGFLGGRKEYVFTHEAREHQGT